MLLNGDEEWFGSIDNNGGEDISAANLKQQTTYAAAGWDFPGTWTFGNGDYLLPVLSKLSTGLQPQILPAHLAGASSVKFPALDAVSIGVTNDELVILNKPVNTTAEVLDYSGRLLLKGNSDRYSITSLATGVYLLRVGSQTLKFIKK
jgi:hypothetical protein